MAPRDFVSGLPKCELHVHLEGTLEPEMAEAVARRHGLASAEGVGQRTATFEGLAGFLAQYYAAMDGLREEGDFYELASAYLARAAAQGVAYAEMFFDPQAHTGRGVPFEAVVTGIHRAQRDALERGGPRSQLIMCFLRDESVESAERTLEASLAFKDWIVGVGLDSDERGNPPAKFAEVFARARASGYRLTMHCDPNQPGSVSHLWQCLEVVAVERVDHGVDCLRDERLCAELARRRLGLTVCPLSNLALYGDLMADAVREMLDRGLKVTVNSDDPAYFGGYVADNLRAVQEAAGLSDGDLVTLTRNAFESAWLTASARGGFLSRLDEYAGQRS